MTRRLVARVTLEDPDTRQHVSFGPGGEVPGWAAALITNPLAWAEDDGDEPEDDGADGEASVTDGDEPDAADGEASVTDGDEPDAASVSDGDVTATEDATTVGGDEPDVEAPPRSGAGSGVGAWAKHARALGVPVTDDMSRDDIIAAVDAL